MSTLAVDAVTVPRSYRIGGRRTDVAGGAILLAVLAVPLAWSAIAFGPAIIERLSPRSNGDLPWVWWGLSQAVFASALLLWSALSLAWALGAAVLAVALLVPGHVLWRLDGAGLSRTGRVGRLALGNQLCVPFEAIAQIQHYKTQVMLHVWRAGVARFECAIAMDLSVDDAQQLTAMLNEDLAAAAAEWEAQGLRINRRTVNRGE